MERFIRTAKHGKVANLVDARTHLAGAKVSTKHLKSRLEVIKVTHFGITEKPTRDCVYCIARTPLSFGAPCLGNPCEYSHKSYTFRNYIHLPFFDSDCVRLS